MLALFARELILSEKFTPIHGMDAEPFGVN